MESTTYKTMELQWAQRQQFWFPCQHFHGIYWNNNSKKNRLFKRLSLIVRVNVVLNRTVVVDSDWRFDNLCGSHLQSQSELFHVSWWYYTLVIDLIGQLCRDVIGRLSVKQWCYWLWRLVISDWCVSIRLLSQLNSRLVVSLEQQFGKDTISFPYGTWVNQTSKPSLNKQTYITQLLNSRPKPIWHWDCVFG